MLDRERGQLFIEGQRGNRSGGVVGIVHPHQCGFLPGLLRHRREIGQKGVGLEQRQAYDLGAGEAGTALGHRIGGIGDQHEILRRPQVGDLREGEDGLLATEGRDQLVLGVDGDAEALVAPLRDSAPELEQADRARVLAALGQVGGDGLANERLGLLVRVAHPEVDDLNAACRGFAPGLVEANERVGAELFQYWGKAHQISLERKRRMTAKERSSCAISTRSSARCA